jgi:hypothetical protein
MLLTDFREEYLDRLLGLLWRQWTAIGVRGQVENRIESVIDPDALLVFTCTMARRDVRLFDAVLEWLGINGRFINVQRVKRMLKEETFSGGSVLGVMAAATKTSADEAKWERLIGKANPDQRSPEPLFYLPSGDPLPVVREPDRLFADHGFLRDRVNRRKVAGPFLPGRPSNLLLRLRALFGVNARSEILHYLMLNGEGSPRAMARDEYYFSATISKALAEMSRSGFLVSRVEGRRRLYKLVPDSWQKLLIGKNKVSGWVVWARLFSALEQVWLFLSQPDLAGQPALAQASALRRLLQRSVHAQLERSIPSFMSSDDSVHPGVEIIPYFVAQVRKVLDQVERV